MPTRMERGRRGDAEGDTFEGSSASAGRDGSFLIERVGEPVAEDADGGVGGERRGGVGNGGLELTVHERVRERTEGDDAVGVTGERDGEAGACPYDGMGGSRRGDLGDAGEGGNTKVGGVIGWTAALGRVTTCSCSLEPISA